MKLQKKLKIKNFIIAEINIEEEDINKKIRIINSFKQSYLFSLDNYKEEDYANEEEIKENSEIKINNKKIEFCYFYKFKEKGKYIIEYIFLKNIEKTDFMFYKCESLTNINLSNFNTQNATNMSHTFRDCHSSTNINLSNIKTQNVTNMNSMFYCCHALMIWVVCSVFAIH